MATWHERLPPWGWFAVRLASVVLLPVLWLTLALGTAWLVEYTHILVILLMGVPLLLAYMGLLMVSLVLFITDAWGTPGHVAWVAALLALIGGSFTVGQSAETWFLRWQGAETTCTVTDVQRRVEPNPGTKDGPPETEYDHQLRCEAPDAPDEMTTPQPVSGDRVRILYDPWNTEYALPVSEFERSAPLARLVGVCFGLWTVLSLGLVLLGMPLRGSSKSWPS